MDYLDKQDIEKAISALERVLIMPVMGYISSDVDWLIEEMKVILQGAAPNTERGKCSQDTTGKPSHEAQ